MPLYEFEGRVPQIAPDAYVAPSAQVIGRVLIGRQCYIGHGAILRGDYGTIYVGDGSAVEEGVIVHARPGDVTRIGKRVTLGHGAMVHNATILDEAVIGMRATISDFSEVGEGAIIGEMGLVKQHQKVPARKVAVGIPVEVVGDVSARNRDMTVWAKDLYVDLARRYPDGLREIPPDGRAEPMLLRPIGTIRTPFREQVGTPIQGAFAGEAEGLVKLLPQYIEGLADLDGFSHLILLYAFHRSRGFELEVEPYLDSVKRGLFATRAPRRPNPIGLTLVRLLEVRPEGELRVAGVDMLDGTPLLDIKPHVPAFDSRQETRVGWLTARLEELEVGEGAPPAADRRFEPGEDE